MDLNDYKFPPRPTRGQFCEKELLVSKTGKTIENIIFDKEAYINAIRTFWKDTNEINNRFKADCLKDSEVSNHPNADKMYDLAYSMGHPEGLSGVVFWVRQLSELLK